MAIQPFPVGIPAGVGFNDVRARAKALLKSVQAGESAALDRTKSYFKDPSSLTLQRAQLVLAREHGFPSWKKLKAFVDARDKLADCQRKFTNMPREDMSAWRNAAEELHRLAREVAGTLGRQAQGTDGPFCTFCFEPHTKDMKLIAGLANFICDRCVDRCVDLTEPETRQQPALGEVDHLPCSFCGKSTAEVDNLVAASGSSICNECLDVCVEIVSEDPGKDGS